MSFKRAVLLQKEVEADAIWNRLPVQYDAQTYQLVTVSLAPDEGDDAAEYVLAILDEIGWTDTVLIGHEADSRLAQEVAARVPKRISGLFLVDPPTTPSDVSHPSIIPTLIAAREQITNAHYPGSELHLHNDDLHQLVEIFHAFCSLRQPPPSHSTAVHSQHTNFSCIIRKRETE